jgi:hypothetical protein
VNNKQHGYGASRLNRDRADRMPALFSGFAIDSIQTDRQFWPGGTIPGILYANRLSLPAPSLWSPGIEPNSTFIYWLCAKTASDVPSNGGYDNRSKIL